MQPNPNRPTPTNPPGAPGPRSAEVTKTAQAATPNNVPTPTGNSTHKFEVRPLPIDDISTDGRRRTLNREKVDRIAESIQGIGVKSPITVQKVSGKWRLVAGFHRLHAAKKLGHTHIDCYVLEGDETDARLWELAENLFRADLTVLERAEHLEEWVRLINEKKPKGEQVAQPGGRQPNDRGVSEAARELNVTREEVGRAKRIVGISEEAKERVRQTEWADNQSALIKLAAQAPEEQMKLLDRIIELKRVPPTGPGKPKDKAAFERAQKAWESAKDFRDAFAKLVNADRERLFKVMRNYQQ
jgi:ParB family chromosome partitioning protein